MSPRWSVLFLLLAGCGATPPELTYYGDVQPILEARCATCHRSDDIAPFPLTRWEEVEPLLGLIEYSVRAGSMPPWKPSHDCNEYVGDSSLRPSEEATLLAWLEDGAPSGDPSEARAPLPAPSPWAADLELALPEPYLPTVGPDDYRCQLIPWPLDAAAFITGIRVRPDVRAMLHHTILFAVSAEQAATYAQLDADEAGPGYTCFGGVQGGDTGGVPTGGTGGTRWVGSWVPGTTAPLFPAGTGLPMAPGDLLIAQMHYNTLSTEPVPDQSSIEFKLAERVDREAFVLPFTDVGWVTGLPAFGGPMLLPAGEERVVHSTSSADNGILMGAARSALGLDPDSELWVHAAGHHMHQLGTWGRQSIRHADGSETCLLEIEDWDFGWQGGYQLVEPLRLGPSDALELSCAWDNSAANQIVVDGVPRTPTDVQWGEGTTDEMCLASLYLTGP